MKEELQKEIKELRKKHREICEEFYKKTGMTVRHIQYDYVIGKERLYLIDKELNLVSY